MTRITLKAGLVITVITLGTIGSWFGFMRPERMGALDARGPFITPAATEQSEPEILEVVFRYLMEHHGERFPDVKVYFLNLTTDSSRSIDPDLDFLARFHGKRPIKAASAAKPTATAIPFGALDRETGVPGMILAAEIVSAGPTRAVAKGYYYFNGRVAMWAEYHLEFTSRWKVVREVVLRWS